MHKSKNPYHGHRFLDEVFISVESKRQYLWRAVDQDGDVIDILVQSCRNKEAGNHPE